MNYTPFKEKVKPIPKVYTVRFRNGPSYAVLAFTLADAFRLFGSAGMPETVECINHVAPVSILNAPGKIKLAPVIVNPEVVHTEVEGRWEPYAATNQ